ncbi:patatin-like phospholipase family protein [Caproicibacter fermentans]|uniref:Patatin-like phospholipase family protein n=1 Tax=Caproicibacter fermentans TaxID=2576756 RepID=A0A7G8T6B1_9FIRM|nr:patatin-like phospholipase family protein [Caproicibacter fermentans]QNK39152.1 patatin-like phospholipase family protein [Caproicibacter fermentans]
MSFGIALAGGGIRGAAHVGVLLALEENGLRPESAAGTSAGGIVAGLYAAGVSAARLKKIVLELSQSGPSFFDPDLTGLASLIPNLLFRRTSGFSGLLKGNRLERYLYRLTEGKFLSESHMRIVIPSVDLCSGSTIACTNTLKGVRPIRRVRWTDRMRFSDAMRATSAVPAVFRPKIIDCMCLVDGGVTDVLPIDLLLAAGERNVLAVDVSEDYEMPKNLSLIEVASHSLAIMETRLRECVTRGEKMILDPDLPETDGLLNLSQMPMCMEAGYRAAQRAMPRIRSLFA